MGLIGSPGIQGRIDFATGFITPGSAMGQSLAIQDAINRPQGRHGLYGQIVQLPLNGLGATKQTAIIETQPYQFNRLFHLFRHPLWVILMSARLGFKPIGFTGIVTSLPFEEPTARLLNLHAYGIDSLPFQITLDSVTACSFFVFDS